MVPSYLERYQNGEYEQVWQELVALGEAVRREPIYSDAMAVARETMRRSRHNIDLLIAHLNQIGYDFRYPPFEPPSPLQIAEIDAFEKEVGPVPLSLRAWAEVVGEVSFMGTYPRLSYYTSGVNPLLGKVLTGDFSMADVQNFFQNQVQTSQPLDIDDQFVENLNGQMGKMLESMRSAMSMFLGHDVVSDVQADYKNRMEKAKPEIPEADQIISDPLVVSVFELSTDAFEEWQEMIEDDERDGTYLLAIAPDALHKANYSGGEAYEIRLPDAAADAPLLETDWGALTFVEYLRLAFAWGGFPGLQSAPNRDDALLEKLKAGLLPL